MFSSFLNAIFVLNFEKAEQRKKMENENGSETDIVYITQRVHEINWEKNRNIKCPYQTCENAIHRTNRIHHWHFFLNRKIPTRGSTVKVENEALSSFPIFQFNDGPYIKLRFKILSTLTDSFSDLLSNTRAE